MTLIDKVAALEGPNREVDTEICIALQYGGLNSEGATNVRTDPDWDGDLLFEIGSEECCCPIPELTASVDAAIALVKKVHPPAWIRLDEWFMGEAKPSVAAILPKPTPNETYSAKAATLPIALVLALLKSMEADRAILTEAGGSDG